MAKTGMLRAEREIGYNVSRIMNEQNMTIEQFIRDAPISEIRFKGIITGSVDVHDDEVDLIAQNLGVENKDLLKPVADEELQKYNVHYMGKATNSKDMNDILDKLDIYVRLLNAQSGE